MKNEFLNKVILRDESFSDNSSKIRVRGNKRYKVNTIVAGKKGHPNSAYFSAILLDENNREIGRQIRWITDFTGNPINYKLIFTTKPETKYLILGYRFNIETPVSSDLEIQFLDPASIKIDETNEEIVFDDLTKFQVPKLPPLTTEQENDLEKKIIWLCAPPRSGTTWLGTRLLNHPQNIIWHEPWIGFHLGVLRGGMTPAKDFTDSSPESILLKSKKVPKVTYNFERILDMQAGDGEYFFSPYHKNNWLPALRKLLLARTFSHAQILTKNIIIKDPVGSNGTDILLESLPHSKIIFLIRDGRDEVDSRMDMHKSDSWAEMRPFKNEEARLKGIAYYSKLWTVNAMNIKKGFDSHNTELKLIVRYEDLIKDTFSQLKKIYDFIKVDITDNELKKKIKIHDFKNIPQSEKGPGKFNRSAKIGAWKDNFTENEKDLINTIMAKTLEKFGYEL